MKGRPAPLVTNLEQGLAKTGSDNCAEREVSALLTLVGAGLRQDPIAVSALTPVHWSRLVQIASANKLLIHAAKGISVIAGAPSELKHAINRYRTTTLAYNGSHLAALGKVSEAFTTAGIGHVVIKGPMAQHALHGDCFLRPSTDIDLLVHRRDFTRSAAALVKMGYTLPEECKSSWWRDFLGEQHFLHSSAPPVDLHHRLQQPGCPAPDTSRFLEARAFRSFGGQKIPVLDQRLACLLSCMSLVKGIVHREPAGAHACDVYAHAGTCSDKDLADLDRLSRQLGLHRTLIAGQTIALRLFGQKGQTDPSRDVLGTLPTAELLRAVFTPEAADLRMPRRSRLLWELSDSHVDFVRELIWTYSAEVARWTGRRPRSDAKLQSA